MTLEELKQEGFEENKVLLVEYNDWDDFVKKHFPELDDYEIVAEEELSNDVTFSTALIDVSVWGDYKKNCTRENLLKEFKKYRTRTIINILILENVLPVGYILNIKISW